MAFLANVHIRNSKLRKREPVALGPRYTGSSVKRKDLIAEVHDNNSADDDPFGSSRDQASDVSDGEEEESTEHIVDPDQVGALDHDNPQISDDDEIDSENAFGDSDDEHFRRFFFGTRLASKDDPSVFTRLRGTLSPELPNASTNSHDNLRSNTSGVLDHLTPSSVNDESADSETGYHSSSSDTSEPPTLHKPAPANRAALRKLMLSEQNSVVANLSREAMADVAKGKAVLQQQVVFSALLNCRIRLQKALTIARDIDGPPISLDATDPEIAATVESAQLTSLALWDSLNSLRASLHIGERPALKVQKNTSNGTVSTPRLDLLSEMQLLEKSSLNTRRSILSKWSTKTAPPSIIRSRNKFSASSSQPPFLNVLDSHLNDSKITSQLSKSYEVTDPSHTLGRSYDDTPFYTTLLRDLVSQRSSSMSLANSSSIQTFDAPASSLLPRPTKQHRANLDTKASKGRKMRYTVHEKLQNFMPQEDRGTWGERQVDELFGGLLGRKIQGGLDEIDEEEKLTWKSGETSEGSSELENGHDVGFRLFGT